MDVAKILPGEFYVTLLPEVIVTVLGSCIAACIRDPLSGVGGMNHFMLPEGDASGSWSGSSVVSLATRFGNHAMESLINEILKRGARRDRLEVKLFGGGRMITGMSHVGRWNIEFVHAYVAAEGLRITAEDVDGPYPRKVYYDPQTGSARVRYLRSLANSTIADRERDYRRRLEADAPAAGSIDLF